MQFNGWKVVKGNSVLNDNKLIIGITDTILWAEWSEYITLEINLDGGTVSSDQSGKYKSGTVIELETPVKEGYTFTGWTVLGTGTVISGTNLTIGISDITLLANWEANTYTISYELNGGTNGNYAPTSGKYGSTVIVSNPTRENYTFTGWTVSGTGASMSGTNLTIGLGNIKLTASWKMINTIPVFTYTGSYQIVDDNDNVITTTSGNWKIRFLSSGTLVFTDLRGAANGIDVFLVGGGGNGGGVLAYRAGCYGYAAGGGGGGGGYRTTQKGVTVSKQTSYSITVAPAGGTSTAFGYSANGGSNGTAPTDLSSTSYSGKGGAGGSVGGTGGLNAVSGEAGGAGGYEFNGTSGKQYGGGGGGGHGHNGGAAVMGQYGAGGAGGGGNGNGTAYGNTNYNGQANTGGGGGGASYRLTQTDYYPYYSSDGYTWVNGNTYSAGTGGTGIVIIRNKR